MSFLIAPINLLFFLDAFFLILFSTFLWNSLSSLSHTQSLFKRYPLIAQLLLLISVLLVAAAIEFLYPVNTITLFPLISAQFVKYNFFAGLIAFFIFILFKQIDNKQVAKGYKQAMWIASYLIATYLVYLIIISATIVLGMTMFIPASNPSSYDKITISTYILYPLFLNHIVFVASIFLLQVQWRWLLFLVYSLNLAYIYHLMFG